MFRGVLAMTTLAVPIQPGPRMTHGLISLGSESEAGAMSIYHKPVCSRACPRFDFE